MISGRIFKLVDQIDRSFLIEYFDSNFCNHFDQNNETLGLINKMLCDPALENQIILTCFYYLEKIYVLYEIDIRSLQIDSLLYSVLTCLILSTKYLMDKAWYNQEWCKLYSVSLETVNEWELDFLDKLDFNLNLGEEYLVYVQEMLKCTQDLTFQSEMTEVKKIDNYERLQESGSLVPQQYTETKSENNTPQITSDLPSLSNEMLEIRFEFSKQDKNYMIPNTNQFL
ncbi:hypothetical protein M0812_16341 [Anaeramoeba flamelloides]|uniref:Cyclin n=1 Tax=Anaeramoeba flamelloides TaxID=1746091 RepID=A0AAV7ZGJ9_9EUKA|nr:hypothetical protein M0812_16341 [Anaeramoeba flamelloides]|eukprot:Anaeramoba_flamelloidesa88324_121.p1 GENE.a88324_121~~a88324_121.p1  ORF type:complete len:227 (+),score=54.80 a88324_121:56-736(+)